MVLLSLLLLPLKIFRSGKKKQHKKSALRNVLEQHWNCRDFGLRMQEQPHLFLFSYSGT